LRKLARERKRIANAQVLALEVVTASTLICATPGIPLHNVW
jgi:hypothetical protein